MRIVKLILNNYRSFGPEDKALLFHTRHSLLVGKNNSGKSNVFSALNILIGAKNPLWIKPSEDDFNDPSKPIRLTLELGGFNDESKKTLFSLPNITKQQQGALGKKPNDDISIILSFERSLEDGQGAFENEDGEDTEEQQEKPFEITLWGFKVHRKVEEIRRVLCKMLLVPAIRDAGKELSASQWTVYGQLMKEVLRDSPSFDTLKKHLEAVNTDIQSVFANEKKQVVEGARVVSYVDDIDFQLTKEGDPTELLRNLEVFVTEHGRKINIQNMGTGTQSAVIIGIFELALNHKAGRNRLFLIEEPEVFVHPHGIRYLGRLLRKITDDLKNQVIASTHAPALAATFSPQEIIRLGKGGGKTSVHQPHDHSLSDLHYRRMVNAENAEMFMSDGVILVEGDTEKHIFSALGELTLLNPDKPEDAYCDFDKANIAVIRLNGKENLLNFITILNAFDIRFTAVLDKDFTGSTHFRKTCEMYGVDYSDGETARKTLKDKHILVSSRGEIEDLIPDSDLIEMLYEYELEQNPEIPDERKPELRASLSAKVKKLKAEHSDKTSKALESIFGGVGKSTYAIRIAEFYRGRESHPFEGLLRYLYRATSGMQ